MNGAIWQNILYSEWLPEILGSDIMELYNLNPGTSARYNRFINPSIKMEFLSAAFRFGHTLVTDKMFVGGPDSEFLKVLLP